MEFKGKVIKNNELVNSNKLLVGSGTIVNINNKKYFLSVAHNMLYKKI
jgi:hypothetical protein